MKIHNLVSSLESIGSQLGNFGLDIIHRKTNVVHANFVQVADMRVGYRMRMLIVQELNLRSWRYILQTRVT